MLILGSQSQDISLLGKSQQAILFDQFCLLYACIIIIAIPTYTVLEFLEF